MAVFTKDRTPLKPGMTAVFPRWSSLACPWREYSVGWIACTALAIVLATGAADPALPQAGVALIKVDLSVVAKGYRMSKVIGSNVSNDKDEKIGTIDDVIADKNQVSFAVLQVGGFLGMGGHLVVVPYDQLVIDEPGKKITLPGASKDALKNLSEYKYTS